MPLPKITRKKIWFVAGIACWCTVLIMGSDHVRDCRANLSLDVPNEPWIVGPSKEIKGKAYYISLTLSNKTPHAMELDNEYNEKNQYIIKLTDENGRVFSYDMYKDGDRFGAPGHELSSGQTQTNTLDLYETGLPAPKPGKYNLSLIRNLSYWWTRGDTLNPSHINSVLCRLYSNEKQIIVQQWP